MFIYFLIILNFLRGYSEITQADLFNAGSKYNTYRSHYSKLLMYILLNVINHVFFIYLTSGTYNSATIRFKCGAIMTVSGIATIPPSSDNKQIDNKIFGDKGMVKKYILKE